MVLWALSAPLRPLMLLVVLSLTGESGRGRPIADVFITQGTFAYVVLVLLWGTSQIASRIDRLAPTLERLRPDAGSTATFDRIGSVLGPVALTVVVVALATPSTALEYGVAVAVADVPLLALMLLPIMTFVWTYLTVLSGLNRLGRRPLVLEGFPQDRTLGLAPVGAAAFTGFWLVVVASIPALVLSGGDITTFALSVSIVTIVVALFVLSMLRLHSQMAAAKGRYVAFTRSLVAEAYAPIRVAPTLATVAERSATLSAAQALADRADRILEWPIDERMIAFISVVVTGTVTSVAVRLVLLPVGV